MKFLVALNCFTTLMGVSMIIASSYARAQMSDEGWGSLVNSQVASSLGIATGLFTLILSVFGCVGAAAKQKRMLCCYLCGLFIVLAFQIAAAATMGMYANTLSLKDERGVNASSTSLTFGPDIAVNNAALSVFLKCCTGCPNNVCNNPAKGAFSNVTLANCGGSNSTACQFVVPCGLPASGSKCFVYQQNVPQVVPPLVIPDSLCNGLSNVWITNRYIVAPVAQGGCGNGDPASFIQDLDTFVGYSLDGVAAFFTFVAVIEALALVAGLYLVFCAKTGKVQGEDDDQVFV